MKHIQKSILFCFFLTLNVGFSDGLAVGQTPIPSVQGSRHSQSISAKPTPPQPTVIPSVVDPRILTLSNAVLLSLHHNPTVIMAISTRKLSHYAWLDDKRYFHPKFSLTSNASFSKYSASVPQPSNKAASIGPSMTWNLPLGGSVSGTLGYTPNQLNTSGGVKTWNVTINQPLLQGAGYAFNQIHLETARDAETTANYTLRTTLMSTISSTISDYYAILQSKLSLQVAESTLKQRKKDAFNRKMLFQAGRKSQSDVDQSLQDLKTQEQAVEKASQSLKLAKLTFLDNDLGLPESTRFEVLSHIDIKPIHPEYQKTLQLAKQHNLTYLAAVLAFKGSKRKLLTDRNAMKWTLGLKLSRQQVDQYGSNNISAGQKETTSTVSLNLSIPLDTVTHAKQRLQLATDAQNAKLTYQKALLALQSKARATLVTLDSDWQALQLAKENLVVTKKNTEAAQLKFKYNKLDALTLATQQQSLVTSQNAIINAEITYLKDKVNYQTFIGSLLDDWHIKIKDHNND